MVEREAPRSTAEHHISLPKTFGVEMQMNGSKDLTFVVEQMDGMKQPKHSSCQLCLKERPLLSAGTYCGATRKLCYGQDRDY